jgi:DNA-binding CsgD family transcriptional regulator
MNERKAGTEDLIDGLSPRERECLLLVDRHLSSKEIARELGISEHTVVTHINRARQRLGSVSRYEAARRVAEAAPADVPSAWGPPSMGMADTAVPPLDEEQFRGTDRERTSDQGNRGQRPDHAQGSGHLPRTVAGDPARHRAAALDQLAAAGASARGPGDQPGQEADGWAARLGYAQTGAFQASGDGDPRSALHRGRPDGRDLRPGWAGGRNELTLPQRAAFIVVAMICAALAFGTLLVGLREMNDIF